MRRNTALRPSMGTKIPATIRLEVHLRDNGCVGPRLGFPDDCESRLELDHVRVGGTGMKSRTTPDNLVVLCFHHHRYKTEHGRTVRPILLDYLRGLYPEMEP